MSTAVIGYYRAGTSFLHRTPAWAKLTCLLALGIALAIWRQPLATGIALAAVIALLLATRVGVRDLGKMLRGFWVLLVVLMVFHTWQSGFWHAFAVVGGLLTIILAANLVTITTPTEALIATLTTALTPLRIFGVRPEAVAFALALTLRTIPIIFNVARATREAAKARGLERNPRALLIPMVVRTVKHATELGEALTARNLP